MASTSAYASGNVAVAEGFEPSDGGYPSHAFEACSLGRSDTPPRGSLPAARPLIPIADRAGILHEAPGTAHVTTRDSELSDAPFVRR